MKTKSYRILGYMILATLFSHCKKDTINIPNTDHMQFTVAGQVHQLGNLQAYDLTGNDYQMASTVVRAQNMAPNDPADVGESLYINIFHTAMLKAGDTFVTNDITKAGVLFTYTPNNSLNCTSAPGKQGTLTITDVASTYIKGTFSVQEFTILNSGGDLSPSPSYTIVSGTFYSTRQP